jgi:ketopantoate reductase
MITATFIASNAQGTDMIIGPGALGLFLAWDQGAQSRSANMVFLGKRNIAFPVSLRSSSESVAPITAQNCFFYTKATSIDWTQIDRVFVAVQPDQIENVVSEISKSPLRDKALVVFCNNGIVNNKNVTTIIGSHPNTNIVRALMFAGLKRITSTNGTLVEHSGGHRVVWGWLKKNSPTPSLVLTGNILAWEYSDNIVTIEAEKLFTNLVLAEVIGCSQTPNGQLFNLISAANIEFAARQFCEIFCDRNLTAQSLISSLAQTVNETANNTNSASLALLESNTAPRDAFRSAVETQAKCAAEALELYKLLRK